MEECREQAGWKKRPEVYGYNMKNRTHTFQVFFCAGGGKTEGL